MTPRAEQENEHRDNNDGNFVACRSCERSNLFSLIFEKTNGCFWPRVMTPTNDSMDVATRRGYGSWTRRRATSECEWSM